MSTPQCTSAQTFIKKSKKIGGGTLFHVKKNAVSNVKRTDKKNGDITKARPTKRCDSQKIYA